ncbi:MAG: hypothetical protein ACODAE_00785 [Gemmatimonadota bacterium]
MDGLIELIIFALILLGSFAGSRKKKEGDAGEVETGAGNAPRTGRRPEGPRSSGSRGNPAGHGSRVEPPGPVGPGAGRERRESAAEMVPDDLWAILTGERRPARAEADRGSHGREEAGGGDAGWSTEPGMDRSGWDDDARSLETVPDREPHSVETIPDPDSRGVASLEQRPLPPEVRRELTVERMRDARGRHAAPLQRRADRGRPGPLPFGLDDRNAVRRAFVLREVLGPPRGLQK